jgi:glycosyltransferase involved in cell wall biosynthesis
MRVLHVITRLIVGGAQENTVASVLGMVTYPGVEPALISGPTTGPEGSLEPLLARSGLLTIVPDLVRPVRPWQDWRALRALTHLFRTRSPDIVHTHSGKAGVLGRLAACRARVPVIVHTIHGPSFGSFQGAGANFLFRAAERQAGKRTTHFVTVAQAMTRQYLAAGIGRPEQYTRIFSGFHLAPFLAAATPDTTRRARLGLAPNDFVIGKIARLFELKGHDDLFAIAPELVKRCPRIKFLLVGDGPWRARFEQHARASGLDGHFIFTGLVPPDEVPRYVGMMDALVHLSTREGLPRALPQALAAAKPVVAYDCDGANEVCLENETGFLIPAGDRARLADRLVQLAHDPALCTRLGHRGQAIVKETFPVERMVQDLHALYLRLAKR